MNIVVSGATGFIGQHLVKRLLDEGHQVCMIARADSVPAPTKNLSVYVFDGDIQALAAFFSPGKFDGVIHLASLFLAQHKTEDVPELIKSNVLFSSCLLEAAAKNNIPWFINTGTFWQHYQNKDYSPVNLYAATKQAFQDIAQYYIETDQINFVTIKLSDTFGPNDIRPKLFTLWTKISKSKERLAMSAGEQVIDISFIDNVIDGYIQMITLLTEDVQRKLNGQSFAVKSNQRMSLKELAKYFEQATGTTLNIDWSTKDYRPREVMIPWENGQTIPGWQPKVPLDEGIRRTFSNEK